jgi:peptidoglycan biosynthesis protein MviN/MurJ (putative lipid II flippase)
MLRLLVKLAAASAVLAGICWAGNHFLLADWATQGFWPKLGALGVVIATGVAAFLVCASALGITELREITHAVKRRLLRRA